MSILISVFCSSVKTGGYFLRPFDGWLSDRTVPWTSSVFIGHLHGILVLSPRTMAPAVGHDPTGDAEIKSP